MNPDKAILLMNLGSPDSTSVKDVKRYLTEFLMDERVIDSPYWKRALLVKGLIVPFRAPRSAKAYQSIWTENGSPLIQLTKDLQQAVQKNFDSVVEINMRYGNPSTEDVLRKLAQNPALKEVVLLPLYPHYAMSSYETAVEQVKDEHRKNNYPFQLTTIKPYYKEEIYINALAESMRPFLDQEYDKILFSYHGIPERHITKCDVTGSHCLKVNDCCHVASPAHEFCYRHQCFKTMELVMQKLNLPKEKVELTFQSRLGRDPWLTPYTAARLTELPKEGVKKLIIVCPAFVSDCLETLEEIAEEGKHSFMESGGESFTLIPCMNVHPLWVDAITAWIKDYFAGDRRMVLN
ncbi:MAG: ferrochelatase [Chitinophagaceae bacterium]|nr:ferrochelatase [Chitinophagaceae bacterium]